MKKVAVFLFLMVVCFVEAQSWQPLFNGRDLSGWKKMGGNATYRVENGEIIGTTAANTPNTFLATEAIYSDFILELELKIDSKLNSGIQVRSESKPDYYNGAVHGYQVEVDPSERAWSGGIYEESRRGWLYPLEWHPEAKPAFKRDQWNTYRIEAIGASIRTWVNGVPVAHLLDDMTLRGFVALQVHSVPQDQAGLEVRWRNIRIQTTRLRPSRPFRQMFVLNLLANKHSVLENTQGWKPQMKQEQVFSLEESGTLGLASGAISFLQFAFKAEQGTSCMASYHLGNLKGIFVMADDTNKQPTAKTASSTLHAPLNESRAKRPVSTWNHALIRISTDGNAEHWLNGFKMLTFPLSKSEQTDSSLSVTCSEGRVTMRNLKVR